MGSDKRCTWEARRARGRVVAQSCVGASGRRHAVDDPTRGPTTPRTHQQPSPTYHNSQLTRRYPLQQVWINQGDIILLSLRDFQDDKADVIQKYTVRPPLLLIFHPARGKLTGPRTNSPTRRVTSRRTASCPRRQRSTRRTPLAAERCVLASTPMHPRYRKLTGAPTRAHQGRGMQLRV